MPKKLMAELSEYSDVNYIYVIRLVLNLTLFS